MHIRFTSPRFKLEFPDPHKKMSDLLDTAGQVLKEEPHHMHIITLVVNDNGQKVGEDIRFRFTPDCEEHLNLSLNSFVIDKICESCNTVAPSKLTVFIG